MQNKKSSIVFLSTYPPRECGIATFTQDLLHATQNILGKEFVCKVAALNLSPLDTYNYPPEVEWEVNQNTISDYLSLAESINNDKSIVGIILQHEYGIMGGEIGENILYFLQQCKKPISVTLHTVLPDPSEKMREITESIVKRANSVVVLTQNSKSIIESLYPAAISKVHVIPHGIHPIPFSLPKASKEKLDLENHLILCTFGLLSRGKGLEYVIRALPEVIKKHPTLMYLILGETHPTIRRNEGEQYRLELEELVKSLGLEKYVRFYNQYLDLPDLFDFLKATDLYIASSTNPNQAVSGTLSYALGAGRAVISTEFAQAREFVTIDTGRLVPIKDTQAFTNKILDLLDNKNKLNQMYKNAYKKTRPMLWSNVAKEYVNILITPKVPPIKLDHLIRMTDTVGLFQFAEYEKPNTAFGYTLDDNARALVFCSRYIYKENSPAVRKLIATYLSFINRCQNENGVFTNYLEYKTNTPTVQNGEEDLEDATSRALWALAETMSNKKVGKLSRKLASDLFTNSMSQATSFTHLRSQAFAIKAFALAQKEMPKHTSLFTKYMHEYANSLLLALNKNSTKSWMWFEHNLNYNNAVLCEALFIAGDTTKNKKYIDKAVQSLNFLIGKTFSNNMYMPIGQDSWYKNHEKRSEYDQQPEDPASMIMTLATAFTITDNQKYKNLMLECFSWFLGNNSLNISMYNKSTGGCYDGLHPDRVNLNQGAESLISYLQSNISISKLINEN